LKLGLVPVLKMAVPEWMVAMSPATGARSPLQFSGFSQALLAEPSQVTVAAWAEKQARQAASTAAPFRTTERLIGGSEE